jgi:hypothetical protein
LQAAADRYDVLVTVDQNLSYQQNLKSFSIAILLLKAQRNTYAALHPLMPQALDALADIKAGEIVKIKAS